MERNIVKLSDCLKCEYNQRFYTEPWGSDSLIECGYQPGIDVVIPVMPSHNNKGFENGSSVVDCMEAKSNE